jgi:hypothetical protein
METPADASPELFDEAGVIVADTACRRCGHNLRGLHQDSRCPECGTPIGLSTHGDLLRFSDPEWVEKLAVGIKYMVWGVVIMLALGIAGGCLIGRVGASPVFLQGVMVLGGLIGVYGAWLLTDPDPSRIAEDRYITTRKIVRFALLVGVLSQVIRLAAKALPPMPAALFTLLIIAGVLTELIGVVGEFAKFSYLGMLADRVPAPNLARWARFLRWALAACTVLGAIYGAVMTLFGTWTGGGTGPASSSAPVSATQAAVGSTSPGSIMPTVCLVGVLGMAVLAFGVMAFILYVRVGRRFREQADLARATWAAASPPEPGNPAPPSPPGP